MKKKSANNNITSEVLAAFLDGNATANESKEILDALSHDTELRELLHISQCVDMEMGMAAQECDIIPMTAMAATCNENNYCCMNCEKYILEKFGIKFDEQQLLENAIRQGWQKAEGTALHNVGRHLQQFGLKVARKYKNTLNDIKKALDAGDGIIAAVDGGELIGNPIYENREDIFIGPIPDHTVVVLSYNAEKETITIYDPNSPNVHDTYPIAQFMDAWNDSKNYLVTINHKTMKEYKPTPIDLSDVTLTEGLNELREAIAENAHDVWALERQAQGWTYGPQRDDTKKQTPCMVAYSELPDSEKKFDRDMAMNTLKLLKKLGYDIIKREDTELYKKLRQRILDAQQEYRCRACGNPLSKHQVYCENCGRKMDIDWI